MICVIQRDNIGRERGEGDKAEDQRKKTCVTELGKEDRYFNIG